MNDTPDAIESLIREAQADAWDEGHHAGVFNATDPSDAPFRDNPYRSVP